MFFRNFINVIYQFFQRTEDHKTSNVEFPIETVRELQGPLELLLPSYANILNVLKDFVEPVHPGSGREISTQTSESDRPRRNDDDPLRVGLLPQRAAVSSLWLTGRT